ncbi:MAG: phosphodiester glycosidase family protein [Treponema sp.]
MRKFFAQLCFVFLLFFSCSSAKKIENQSSVQVQNFSSSENIELEWNKINDYASKADFYINDFKALCHIVKIDLQNEALRVVSFPDERTQEKPLSAVQFAKQNNCSVVFNTTPYSQKVKLISKKIPVGIIQNKNFTYSIPNERYCALAFLKTQLGLCAKIIQFQTQKNLSAFVQDELILCHGGFWQILKDGDIVQFKEIYDSRTAAGISKDEKTLFVFIAEGERKNKSKGLSYMQCASVLKKIGAENAMQFDGGNSTCLIIGGKNALSYPKNPVLPAFIGFSE